MPWLLLWSILFAGGDADGDGLDDAWEQQMLERFTPRLMLSVGECDLKPARFAPGETTPRAVERDGTLYGQVFPFQGAEGAWVEIHYYHLWANDCGRLSHPLDPERVSVLARGPSRGAPASEWKAVYWFAAAHEDTVCDASHGAAASFLDAETRGPAVFISRGKHASYLDRNRCRWGCGGDICKPELNPLTVRAVINLGEPGRPLNGAVWVDSPAWPLRRKMATDFAPAVFERLESKNRPKHERMHDGIVPLQSVVLGGEHTLRGLGTAGTHTEGSLGKAANATGKSIKKSMKAVGGFLGVTSKEKP